MPLFSEADADSFAQREFDYVIVGAGTAGLALAARLAEVSANSVAVIEAGEDARHLPLITTPGLFGSLVMHETHDWNMVSVPQKFANNTVAIQARGKVLGGCSASNFLLTGRATAEEYDGFEKLGNNGWNWDQFLRYFKKSETLIPPSPEYAEKYGIALNPKWHGTSGPLIKSFSPWISSARNPLAKSLGALGLSINPDPDSGDNCGVNLGLSTIDPETATRSYSLTAYFIPNAERENFNVLTQARATRILLEAQSGKFVATGVEIMVGSRSYVIKAKKEVIVCAGALKTPQLLELSGIGPRAVLEKFGIKQLIDLPVGENLQEHYNTPVVFEMHEDFNTTAMDDAEVAAEKELYNTKRVGRFASAPGSVSWIPLASMVNKKEHERLRLLFDQEETQFVNDGKGAVFDLYSQWLDAPRHGQIELVHIPAMFPGAGTPLPGKKYQTLLMTHIHPLSRGTAHIQSADPTASPAIDPAHYKSSFDLALMVDSIRFARKVAQTEPFASTVLEEVAPGPNVQSDEELTEYCKNSLTSMYHGVGTAAMLPHEMGGVVDSNLIVYGTKNLRVVDGSVIPFQLTCHMQMTIYAIAEKAADIIKASNSG